jgi:hypothetical protein
MKIITLNTWGGRAGSDKIINFFKKHKNKIDVFCFRSLIFAYNSIFTSHR